jgi:uncharacterized membrane protein
MSLENSRILGGIGALLMFIGIIPYISYFGIIEIIGLVLVMVALYNLGSYYMERGIFNNALYGLIIGIVGAVISIGDWTALSGLTPDPSNISLDSLVPFLAGIFAVFLILWIFSIITAFFVRRSLGTLSTKSGVGLFSTAGLLLLIGAVIIIIFGIGLILIWISALLLAIAFFQLKAQQTPPTTSTA